MWSKQRKDEVLIDVDDVALGHTTKMRWNDKDRWLWLEKVVQSPRPSAAAGMPREPCYLLFGVRCI